MKSNPDLHREELTWLARKFDALSNFLDINKAMYVLGALGACLFIADFLYKKKSYFDLEQLPGFYALFGFAAAFVLIYVARAVRSMMLRDEDYYAPLDVEAEMHPEHDLNREDYRA